MSIEICNLRKIKPTHPYDIRVDRSSVLGNPFPMRGENQRDVVCDKYTDRFMDIMECNIPEKRQFYDEVHRLKRLYQQHGKLRLFCWCAPKRCHAETIRSFLLNAVK